METMESMENMFKSNYYKSNKSEENKKTNKAETDKSAEKNNKNEKEKEKEKNKKDGLEEKKALMAEEDVTKKDALLSDVTKKNTDLNTNVPVKRQISNNEQSFILDPLSVIIKLAIISNKPVGTKLFIKENVVHIQEPGIFQGLCRYISNTNRNDLQFLYNPIQFACKHFLNTHFRSKTPKMVDLFICAQRGVLQLMETYKGNSVIKLCLNYYYTLLDNYVTELYTPLFRADDITPYYNDTLLFSLNDLWTSEKIKIVLDMICFLNDDVMANDNVKSLDIFIQNMDKHTQGILLLV